MVLNYHSEEAIKLAPDGTVPEGEVDDADGKAAQSVLDFWFGNSDMVVSKTRQSTQPINVRIFVPRWKDQARDVWACWGVTSIAETQWPISSLDTGNVSGRPYACISLWSHSILYESSGKIHDFITMETDGGDWTFSEAGDQTDH